MPRRSGHPTKTPALPAGSARTAAMTAAAQPVHDGGPPEVALAYLEAEHIVARRRQRETKVAGKLALRADPVCAHGEGHSAVRTTTRRPGRAAGTSLGCPFLPS
jgi:hypothetical protein